MKAGGAGNAGRLLGSELSKVCINFATALAGAPNALSGDKTGAASELRSGLAAAAERRTLVGNCIQPLQDHSQLLLVNLSQRFVIALARALVVIDVRELAVLRED